MPRLSALVLGALLILVALASSPAARAAVPADAGWSREFAPDELHGRIIDAVPFRGGLAVCGRFYIPGGDVLQSVAWWDGGAWRALAPLRTNYWYDTKLLAMGDSLVCFWHTATEAHNSRWNGSDWRDFGGPIYGTAHAMVAYGSGMVAGGGHLSADGQPASIARWDGTSWRAMPGSPTFEVSLMIASGDTLVVAGPDSMKMWDGVSWRQMDNGRGRNCQALCWHDGRVVAAGRAAWDTWLSAWDGSAWQPLPDVGYYDELRSLTSCNGRLFACTYYAGRYAYPDFSISRFVILEGDSWRLMAPTAPGLRIWGSELVVLEAFPLPGRVVSTNLSLWDGSTWRGLPGPGRLVQGTVKTIADMGGMPVIGGSFPAAGAAVCRVAGWSGGDWISLMPSGGGTINKLISFGDHSLLLGGIICGLYRNDCSWHVTDYVSSTSSSLSKAAVCAAEHAGRLYVGGEAGKDPNVMRVNAGCPPLKGGIATALASWSGRLFAGGTFADVDSLPVCYIANLDSVAWRQTGEGLDGCVLALAPWGDRLVAGGRFTHSGQTIADHVAVWDGTSWKALGAGFNDEVRALAVMDGRLYAGGMFTASGEVPLAHVAYWDGVAWRALGTGVSGPVHALTAIGTDLWLGGSFEMAGGRLSINVARWDNALVPCYLSDFAAHREGARALASWRIAEVGDPTLFQVWRDQPGQPRVPVGDPLAAERFACVVVDPAPPREAFSYWLQQTTPDGQVAWHGPAQVAASTIPAVLSLAQNHPNPFNPRTTISYGLPDAGRVKLAIYDVRGSRVTVLVDADQAAGEQSVRWDGRDRRGTRVPSGVYFARLETATESRTVKITMAK